MNNITPTTEKATQLAVPTKERVPTPKKLKAWMIATIAGVILLIGGSIAYLLLNAQAQTTPLALPVLPQHLSISQIGLDQWQAYQQPLPAHPLSNPALPATPQKTARLALLQDAAGQALIQQHVLVRGLAYLKAATLSDPDNLRYSNDYRIALRDHLLYQDEQTFFSALSQSKATPNTTIEFALSYVDMMRSCPKPPDGLVCQAQNSYRSITILDKLLQEHPYNIIARFARGLNHLYWPTLMQHLPMAQQDLQYTTALSKVQAMIGPTFVPASYVALGDVFAKSGDVKEAQNVWRNGLKATTNQTQLQQRLAIPSDQLKGQEENQLRGLGVYVDTDISMFWQKG